MYQFTTYDIVSEIAAITGRVVRVVYGQGYSIGRQQDGNLVLTIPAGQAYMTPSVRGGILHETMHIVHTDFLTSGVSPFEKLKLMGYQEHEVRPMFDFLNGFEDIRIQLKGEDDLPGARFIFQAAHDEEEFECFDNIQKHWSEPMAKARGYLCSAIVQIPGYRTCEETVAADTPGTVLMKDIAQQTDFWTNVGLIAKKLKGKFGQELDAKMGWFAEEIRNTKTTDEGFELASKHFMEGYRKLLPPDLQKMYQDQKKMEQMMKDLKEAMEQATEEMMKAGGQPTGKLGDSGLVRAASKDDKSAEDMVARLRSRGSVGAPGQLRPDQGNHETRIKVIEDKSDQIKGHLAPILERVKEWQERGSEREHLKRGKLNGRQLYKVALDEQDVFRREVDPEVTDDVAFSVVVDMSSSMMWNSEGDDALNIGFGLGAGLNKALTQIKKPCTLVTFSNNADVILSNGQVCTAERLGDALSHSGGCTNIQEGIAVSLEELNKRPEKTKVQFIISDGDVDPAYLGESLKQPFEKGVVPYVVYISDIAEYFKRGFDILTADAMGQGHKLKYAVVSTTDAGTLIPQLTKFVEGLLEGKGL